MQIGIVRAINEQLPWLLNITNGPTSNSNVQVTFTLPIEVSISNTTIFPVGSLVGNVWTIGAMTANQTLAANIILKFDGPIPGLSEEFPITATVTGTGDTNGTNNTKTDTILFEVASCDPLAGGVNCTTGLAFDLSTCSTACTQGATSEWFIEVDSENNVEIISFNENTGKGFYKLIDPSLSGSFVWGLNCILGEDTVTICSTYTMTLYPIIDDKNVFDHSADFINGSTLTDPQVALLKAQPAYTAFTNDQIKEFCWEVMYNADGDLIGGWAHQCTGEQDSRHFIFCSEDPCDSTPNPCSSCPYTNMPTDVSDYLVGIENYTAQIGDLITIYHTDSTSIYEYNGTAWERTSCGCMYKISQDAGNILSLGTDNAPYLSEDDLPILNPYPVAVAVTGGSTKTITITMSNATTITTTFTDNDNNTTYTITRVTLLDIDYIRLIDNLGNIVSSVMLPTSGGGCCCDCTFNLIPIQDGAIASTNCDITWTGPEANAIWEARPVTGDEEDWVALDGGYHDGMYDNGCGGCLIRVRYTLDSCERFSNIVTPLVCPCWAEIVGVTTDVDEIYIAQEGCSSINWSTAEWQVRTGRTTWETYQTGGNASSATDNLLPEVTAELPDLPNIVVDEDYGSISAGYVIRVKYVENGCTKYTNTYIFGYLL
jgi:hypothetical protein